jgi:hypothetical protein
MIQTADLLGKCLKAFSLVLTPGARLFTYPGHFYSPIASVKEAINYVDTNVDSNIGIHLDDTLMFALFECLSKHFQFIYLPERATEGHRYYYDNPVYPSGDALVLSSFIREFLPRRIVEVGCGFSSAIALDTADQVSPHKIDFTFIDPNLADRFDNLLMPDDRNRVKALNTPVQQVNLEVFDRLESGDLLFLDTTHVSKTGSDVNHEIFQILPRLKPGVFVHFHDVFRGWEYPRYWIETQNRSFNELYMLRAFLMYNQSFEIVFFNDHVFASMPSYVMEKSDYCKTNLGCGLYLRKVVD